jgi:hypothetical protein
MRILMFLRMLAAPFSAHPGYASTGVPIAGLANKTLPGTVADCPVKTGQRPHFVTHSVGGILLRNWFQTPGPPNQRRELVDALEDWQVFALLKGSVGMQLGTGTVRDTCEGQACPSENGS